MSSRLDEIIAEAIQCQCISRITPAEKDELASIYNTLTGEVLNLSCGACVIKACYEINKHKNILNNGKKKANNRRGTGRK